MIPIRDTIQSEKTPVVTYFIMVINLLTFGYELSLDYRVDQLIMEYGLIPIRDFYMIFHDPIFIVSFLRSSITSMFLHGGWIHIIGNLYFLWLFGDNVEDRLGHLRFIIFYILCGIGGALLQSYMHPLSQTPMIGASGAISGILGAYLLFYPYAKIIMMVPLFAFYPIFFEIPAILFIVVWVVEQLYSGMLEISALGGTAGGVAWWCHLGGFSTGIILALILKPKVRRKRYLDEFFPW